MTKIKSRKTRKVSKHTKGSSSLASSINRIPLIYYHHGCRDGIAGAWTAWKHFNNNIEHIGVQPSNKIIANIYDHGKRDVYFIDVVTADALDICKYANTVTIIDHHISNMKFLETAKLPANVKIVTNVDLAASQLAWDFFNPGVDRPWFINYIADKDLWTWSLEDSRIINSGLYNLGYFENIKAIENIYIRSQENIVELLDEVKKYGTAVEKHNDSLIRKLSGNALLVRFKPPKSKTEYTCWLSTIHSELLSDYGNILAEKTYKQGQLPDFAAIYVYDLKKDRWIISLRSRVNGADVSEIAKELGGGGHVHASSFIINPPNTLKDYFHSFQ